MPPNNLVSSATPLKMSSTKRNGGSGDENGLQPAIRRQKHKSQRARMHVQTLANEDTLLPTQMSPRLPACATFVADTHFVSGTQQMFLILFRNNLCPQQMFPSLRSPKNITGNNMSATVCPRLPGPCYLQLVMVIGLSGVQFSLESYER